jgi:Flp pilus assembly pilin Flp
MKDRDPKRWLQCLWARFLGEDDGLTTLEYVMAAGIIIVVLAAAILAWNNGLAAKIGDIIDRLTKM